jgi:hypothetical protein
VQIRANNNRKMIRSSIPLIFTVDDYYHARANEVRSSANRARNNRLRGPASRSTYKIKLEVVVLKGVSARVLSADYAENSYSMTAYWNL